MPPRARVILDNDYAGDPDGLFQLAHHVLSPSVEIPFVIASRLPSEMGPGAVGAPERGASAARHVLELVGSSIPVIAGSDDAIVAGEAPLLSAASEFIIREALRDDTDLPLYVAAGGGLTDVAGAILNEPSIVDKLTLVWIGGQPYGLDVNSSSGLRPEFNTMVDFAAAQVVFGSTVPIWQVPQDVYAQCLVSWAELDARVQPIGALGAHLVASLRGFVNMLEGQLGMNLGETFILGDNPLVLLTALQSTFDADPSTSRSIHVPRPVLTGDGRYDGADEHLPAVRVFTDLDTRLMLADMYAKFESVHRS